MANIDNVVAGELRSDWSLVTYFQFKFILR